MSQWNYLMKKELLNLWSCILNLGYSKMLSQCKQEYDEDWLVDYT